MSRIPPVDPSTAEGRARELLEGVQRSLGATPNLYRVIAQSPAALEGVLGLAGALARGRIRARLREQIALTVSEANGCEYCLSAHSALGAGLGLPPAELERARQGRASNPRDEAALRFVGRVIERRGRVDDAELAEARAAGLDDGQLVELVANAALTVFTNYLNEVAGTEIDFPVVHASGAKAA
ncbi:carboxymuconolactone decarboxylase family protein [Anaeromyxobacter sp. SG64]|uniref:carboxymuconolactone decarboxylase family protein n=1 Tax=Anaeromyxobacter sp. SG64 TaxID=2925409 RepID=UPI001F59B5C2|nr:carboxymuconolactone decarboxylase family protein [Anaeromyxobacter sp. SG64]